MPSQPHRPPLQPQALPEIERTRQAARRALDDLQRAHALEPKSAAILSALAECLNALGRPKLAILTCGDALAIDDKLASAWLHKGRAYEMLNRPERARLCYRKALHLDPALAATAQTANGRPMGPPVADASGR